MSSLSALTSPEAQAHHAAGDVLAVPVGATEQHGPHLPLTTDTDMAVALVHGLSRQRPGVVVAPPVAYGASGEHAGFAGTVSIGQEAIELLLLELGRSASATFERILLVTTHGGNAQAVRRAVDRLRYEGRDVRAWAPRWAGDAHAGRTETSLMLAIAPERVRLDRAAAGNPEPLVELLPRLRAGGVRGVSENGVLGDPSGSSAREGQHLLDAAVRDLVATVASWKPRATVEAAR